MTIPAHTLRVEARFFLAIMIAAMLASVALAADTDTSAPVMTPEQRMQARFPQPVRVGALIGAPVLDDNDATLGHVREVVRTKDDKVKLIVAYGGWFGSDVGARLVAVPIEVVAILGRQLASIDMPRSDYPSAPTWQRSQSGQDVTVLPRDATIRIALGRR